VKTVVLLILGLAWVAVLVPAWLQRRVERKPADSIAQFQTQLSVLERRLEVVKAEPGGRRLTTNPAGGYQVGYGGGRARPGAPTMTLSAARRRRRNVLSLLFVVALVSVVPAVFWAGRFVLVSLAAVALFVGYGAVLRQIQVRKEQRAKIRYLPRRVAAGVGAGVVGGVAEPALLRHVGT
jgi:hypothetical protein